jgi:hypothetical protein
MYRKSFKVPTIINEDSLLRLNLTSYNLPEPWI